MLMIGSKSFTVKGYDVQAKINVFSQLTLLSNNLLLTSYLSGIYLESWVFLVMRWSVENIQEKKKTERRKRLKSEEKE